MAAFFVRDYKVPSDDISVARVRQSPALRHSLSRIISTPGNYIVLITYLPLAAQWRFANQLAFLFVWVSNPFMFVVRIMFVVQIKACPSTMNLIFVKQSV